MEDKLILHRKLQNLPRNSAPVRLHNRCTITGRPRGYYSDFGLSRHVLREYAFKGYYLVLQNLVGNFILYGVDSQRVYAD